MDDDCVGGIRRGRGGGDVACRFWELELHYHYHYHSHYHYHYHYHYCRHCWIHHCCIRHTVIGLDWIGSRSTNRGVHG